MTISKKSFRSGPYAALIAQAVQVDNVLYLSGQVGMGEDGTHRQISPNKPYWPTTILKPYSLNLALT